MKSELLVYELKSKTFPQSIKQPFWSFFYCEKITEKILIEIFKKYFESICGLNLNL